jgi:hypothetical protein
MPAARIAHPTVAERKARGKDAWGRTSPSIIDFSERYADQNERDFQEFVEAVRTGRLEAIPDV